MANCSPVSTKLGITQSEITIVTKLPPDNSIHLELIRDEDVYGLVSLRPPNNNCLDLLAISQISLVDGVVNSASLGA